MSQVRTRQVKKPEVRKAEIVRVALGMFVEQGFERTTVDGITGRLGVAKGCFYHHFRSKNDVFDACVVELADRLLAEYLAILTDPALGPRRRLVAYLDHNYAAAAAPAAEGFLRDLHSGDFGAIHRRVTDAVEAALRPVFVRVVEEGVAAGEFEVADPEFAAVAVLGALTALHAAHAGRPGLDLVEHREQVLDLLARMLNTPDAGMAER